MKLLIVESPAKSKTISKYLGKDYKVKASVGHIRDLPKSNKVAIDIENGFKPSYEISKGKEKIVEELSKLGREADEIILATDPDREGEAIAWHIIEAIKEQNGETNKIDAKVKRIVFHEITKEAIKEALEHPRGIDENLREAQEARRVLDRLVGYDLSGLIWKKVRYGLSAGRVQSPALRIVVEREREIKAFIPETFWVITAETKTDKQEVINLTCTVEPKEKEEVEKILNNGKKGKWIIKSTSQTDTKRAPRAPFTTSTLQQTASSRLGLSPSRTMGLAQKLYEAGHITYMRTDSTNLSANALSESEKLIKEKYGNNYHSNNIYKTRSKNAQEAHEAIRPTNFKLESAGSNEAEERLYKLIWQRTVSSQMSNAKILKVKILANTNENDIPDFTANGSRVIFDGWLKADPFARGEDALLPEVEKGDVLHLKKIESEEKQTQPPNRYSEAGLVKELEKRGIGRPSTYASTIKTLGDRGYTEKEGRSLKPTDTGEVVSGFLENNFAEYISDSFTAEMEDELDEIAEGKREYANTLKNYYEPLHKSVEEKAKNLEKITNLGKADDKHKCPTCKGDMIIKLGKSGRFLSCEKFPDCKGSRTIDGEEIPEPKETGEECPKCEKGKLIERVGKFGKFISCDRYPKCKYIKQDENNIKENSTGVKCPKCDIGFMTEKKGRFGLFYGCSNYPDCKHIIKTKPTGKICNYEREDGKKCTSLMMEGTKTIPERCSDKTCLNHRPDKLEKESK